jgi:hypothetical protein
MSSGLPLKADIAEEPVRRLRKRLARFVVVLADEDPMSS